ncbi:MAG: hypothetical protein ACKO5C_02505 [Ferruginibacter sp.]
MRTTLLLCFFFVGITILTAQVPEDVIRLSWHHHQGSARYMATGGTMGSLGGDITATFVNPAGLGLYKTREFVFSPSILNHRSSALYRDSSLITKNSHYNQGPIGWVIGMPGFIQKDIHTTVSIAFNQHASFNNRIQYAGNNNFSSFSEQFAEEFANSGYSVGSVLNSNSPLPYTAAPALNTYLIDTVRINGLLQVKATPEYLLDAGGSVRQEMNRIQSGGLYELGLALATNVREKWLYGATLGIPIIRYQDKSTFRESDATGDTSNRFESFTYTDDFRTTGSGIQMKLGVIYRPADYIRLGFAFHTPGVHILKDTRSTTLETRLENPVKTFYETSATFTNGQPGESEYSYTSPWKAMVSASYVFRELADVRRQRAFISADLEYVRHQASRFQSANEAPTAEETSYFKALNQVIKNEYRGGINVRVGGELKFNVIMGRLGFAYYSNPYRDAAFKANRMLLSGGIGYRNKGIFIDLTYVHARIRNVDLPYRLENRANTFANLRQQIGTISGTLGFKF